MVRDEEEGTCGSCELSVLVTSRSSRSARARTLECGRGEIREAMTCELMRVGQERTSESGSESESESESGSGSESENGRGGGEREYEGDDAMLISATT
eukprot:252481-Pleurochrysis_carterae.AAC.3